jgi:hypothetical protein
MATRNPQLVYDTTIHSTEDHQMPRRTTLAGGSSRVAPVGYQIIDDSVAVYIAELPSGVEIVDPC